MSKQSRRYRLLGVVFVEGRDYVLHQHPYLGNTIRHLAQCAHCTKYVQCKGGPDDWRDVQRRILDHLDARHADIGAAYADE